MPDRADEEVVEPRLITSSPRPEVEEYDFLRTSIRSLPRQVFIPPVRRATCLASIADRSAVSITLLRRRGWHASLYDLQALLDRSSIKDSRKNNSQK